MKKTDWYNEESIASVIKKVNENQIFLPALQRKFVWKTKQIEQLFDSIMQGFPIGTFLFCREAGKIMKKRNHGRIINFTSVGTKLKIEGEAAYTASKAAVENLTEVLSREYSEFGITVNAVGPTPVKTDLIRSVPKEKIENITKGLAINRLTENKDISNVTDFFIKYESEFITGQIIYLGGA